MVFGSTLTPDESQSECEQGANGRHVHMRSLSVRAASAPAVLSAMFETDGGASDGPRNVIQDRHVQRMCC